MFKIRFTDSNFALKSRCTLYCTPLFEPCNPLNLHGIYVEQFPFNPLVASSNLARPTSYRATFGWLFFLVVANVVTVWQQ